MANSKELDWQTTECRYKSAHSKGPVWWGLVLSILTSKDDGRWTVIIRECQLRLCDKKQFLSNREYPIFYHCSLKFFLISSILPKKVSFPNQIWSVLTLKKISVLFMFINSMINNISLDVWLEASSMVLVSYITSKITRRARQVRIAMVFCKATVPKLTGRNFLMK